MDELVDWLKFLKDRVGCAIHFTTTKEWSEEDKNLINSIIKDFETIANGDLAKDCPRRTKNYILWLKTIKERVQPQSKQEWSERDEEMIKYFGELLDYAFKNWSKFGGNATNALEWLELLKNRYTWKPSEEQMKILNEILNFAANHESPHWNDYIFGTLNELIRQLKKLREE